MKEPYGLVLAFSTIPLIAVFAAILFAANLKANERPVLTRSYLVTHYIIGSVCAVVYFVGKFSNLLESLFPHASDAVGNYLLAVLVLGFFHYRMKGKTISEKSLS